MRMCTVTQALLFHAELQQELISWGKVDGKRQLLMVSGYANCMWQLAGFTQSFSACTKSHFFMCAESAASVQRVSSSLRINS